MPCGVHFACGKTTTNIRVDAAVSHYLLEAPLDPPHSHYIVPEVISRIHRQRPQIIGPEFVWVKRELLRSNSVIMRTFFSVCFLMVAFTMRDFFNSVEALSLRFRMDSR